MFPFWMLVIIRHLIFGVPKKGTIILTTTHMQTSRESCRRCRHIRGAKSTASTNETKLWVHSFMKARVQSRRALVRGSELLTTFCGSCFHGSPAVTLHANVHRAYATYKTWLKPQILRLLASLQSPFAARHPRGPQRRLPAVGSAAAPGVKLKFSA